MAMKQEQKEMLSRAMALCSRSEKAASDIRRSMIGWGYESETGRDEIIEYLVQNDFINEGRYALAYCRDKHRFNRWGKVKIRAMLRGKDISDKDITDALSSIPDDIYYGNLLNDLAIKRKSIKGSNLYDLKARLMRFAQSRGYETELIYKAIDEVLG